MYAVGPASDGTLTQDPRLCRPPLVPAPLSFALHGLYCEEREDRTRLSCDALTDFQRIVSLCVAERHGQWSFALSAPKPGVGCGGWCCPRCGYTPDDASRLNDQRGSCGESDSVRHVRRFAVGGCRTPCCTAEELRASANQCMHAADALALLERRHSFQQEFGGLLQRISAASRGIQDSVTR